MDIRANSISIRNFASIVTTLDLFMNKKQQSNINPEEGRLFIVHPTLDMLLASCDNIKQTAENGGIEYSNFLKTCKLEKDIRISSYQKCANAFGLDTLIIHLPCGVIDSVVNTQKHQSNRCYTLQGKDLLRILRTWHQIDTSQISSHIELFLQSLQEKSERDYLKQILSCIAESLQILLKDYDRE